MLVYHYTNDEGLYGILNSRNIRFTSYKHMSDPTELMHYQKVLCPIIDTVLKEIRTVISVNSELLCKRFLDSLDDTFGGIYLFCCYIRKNHDNSNMLLNYGKFSLTIDSELFEKFINDLEKKPFLATGEVSYPSACLSNLDEEHEQDLNIVKTYIIETVIPHLENKSKLTMKNEKILKAIGHLICFIKTPCLYEEQEYRFAISGYDTDRSRNVKHNRSKEYIEIHFDDPSKIIKEIKVERQDNQESKAEELRRYLKSRSLEINVSVSGT
jgi:hypothetical protein